MPSASRKSSPKGNPVVLSLMVQAELPVDTTNRHPFAVLVRHLLGRILASESLGLGEEAQTRVTALAYVVALPGMLYALYAYPAYHSPLGKPPFWAQASDHFFYATYAFVVMGLVTVLEWDLLFPDLLDILILNSLPIPRLRLLLARVAAQSIFFGCILAGTSFLGIVFFPLIAELPGTTLRQYCAHSTASLLSALFATSLLVALQGILICTCGQSTARKVSPLIQAACVLLLLTSFFLFPLIASHLQPLLRYHAAASFWFPPFWFLGVYESVMRGSATPVLFHSLAHMGLLATALSSTLALATYPLAYLRRTRQTLEGTGGSKQQSLMNPLTWLLHGTFLRDPRRRAIHHWIGHTVLRTQPTRLVLAVFGGLAFATTVAALVTIHPNRVSATLTLSPYGARLVLPMVTFWAVAGLRTALGTSVGKAGAWVFRVIDGRAKPAHLQGAKAWVAMRASLIVCSTVAALHAWTPPRISGGEASLPAQLLLSIALPTLLTEAFLLQERAIPFTQAHPYSVNEGSYLVLLYFFCFPLFVFSVAAREPWIEASLLHLLLAALALAVSQGLLRFAGMNLERQDLKKIDIDEEQTLLPGEMGLRNG